MDPLKTMVPVFWLVLLRVAVGVIWLRSGLLKIVRREYLEYDEKLERFMSKNPFPWYRTFLERYMLPNSRPAGYLFVAAEVYLGVALMLGFLTVPSALIGVFFNINFRLAAGWQNPSNTPLNYLMIMCQLLVVFSGAGSYLSVDNLLFAASAGR
ncbi:MAG: DoxX family protein [Candidatus Methylomirabilales bacterium]